MLKRCISCGTMKNIRGKKIMCVRCETEVDKQNKEFNEGICKCGHHSKDHSYSLAPKCADLECNKCKCQNYKFDHEMKHNV
jgi:hypothetical protein